ncbi:hypothetical protein [Streptacidiphilus neutrinimicus]|uniref:hypothetical protein n=1 Tax=Streptacidiphilus neutrinimicus TaxID=105420 RepID=UPI00069365B9|nr:hypothetical protein [Streptacidiphilus neutrinimicus]
MHGELALPESPSGVVLLAVGRAGMRRRDEAVARTLHLHGLGTLLLDLLPRAEASLDPFEPVETTALARRIVSAVDWLGHRAGTAHLPVVLLGFGDDTDAVLAAAASRPDQVETVVLLGSGGDLNVPVEWVRAPVLLVVAAGDDQARGKQEQLRRRLRAPFRAECVAASDQRLADPDARERAVGVVARTLRRPRALSTATAAGKAR